MEHRKLTELVHFSPERLRQETLFETDRLWGEVLSLDRNQTFGPATDPDSDAMFVVLAGEGVFVGGRRERRRAKQWGSVLVRAGEEVSVTNASDEPLVLLLVAAPPPVRRAVSG